LSGLDEKRGERERERRPKASFLRKEIRIVPSTFPLSLTLKKPATEWGKKVTEVKGRGGKEGKKNEGGSISAEG